MQSSSPTFDRPNISDALVVALRDRIVDGQLPAGKRVNEVHLAASLGVSRTPLREALGRLAAEGALSAVPRRGFFVNPMTLEEFQQIYPIRAILDVEALRMAGIPRIEHLERLEALNREFRASADANRAIELDDAWHRELLAGCPNRVLLDLIGQFMRRTRRYEVALMRERPNVLVSTRNHDQIIAALRAGDLAEACKALRHNLQSGIEPIESWLRERESKPGHE
jgi:DNA-binding GntR family transcriptional regulator